MADLTPLILTDLLDTFLSLSVFTQRDEEFSNGPMDERVGDERIQQ